MLSPIVIAYHLIWTTYGSWLPNDPRGSGSHTIDADILKDLGVLHYGRKRVQPAGKDIRDFYQEAQGRLAFPVLRFDAAEMRVIASAFEQVIHEHNYTCYACAIMPDHVHLMIRKHKHQAEDMMANLRNVSRLRLSAESPRFHNHPVWTGGLGWKVFLEHPDEIERTIRYVEKNPAGMLLPAQSWPFVKPYDRWPLHPGHSPNSPYVKRLKAAGRYP